MGFITFLFSAWLRPSHVDTLLDFGVFLVIFSITECFRHVPCAGLRRLNPYHTGGQLLIWTEERREVAIPSLSLLFSGNNKADACQKCLDNGGPRRGVLELLPSGRKRKLEDFKAERKQNSTANQSKRKGERKATKGVSFVLISGLIGVQPRCCSVAFSNHLQCFVSSDLPAHRV